MLLVVALVEGEGDDVGDRVDGEAREDDSGARRRDAHSMRLLVRLEAAGREDLVQVCVISVGPDRKAARLDRVERKIAVTGDLSPAERKRLLEIAEMCPVHRTLESGSTVVVSTLVDV